MKIYIFLFALLLSTWAKAQDANFSMFHLSPLTVNPAQIATDDQMKLMLNHRNQWRGIGQPFNTSMLYFVYPFVKVREDDSRRRWGGISASFLGDRQGQDGLLRTTGGSLAFAYNFELKNALFLSLGLQGGYYQRRIDETRLTSGFDNNFNPIFDETLDNNSVGFFNLSSGINFYKEDLSRPLNEKVFLIGIAAFNMNSPDVSLLTDGSDRQNLRLIFNGSLRAWRSENYSIVPNMRWIEQNSIRQVNIGSHFNYHFSENLGTLLRGGTLGLGLWYSVNNAAIASIEINTPSFTAAFSYDFGVSQLNNAPGFAGATELTLGIRKTIGRKKDKKPEFEDNVEEIEDKPTDETKESTTPSDTTRITFDDKDEEKEKVEDPTEQAQFDYNSNQLSEAQKRALQPLIKEMKENPDMVVEVRGHTCTIGTLQRNQEVSEMRAKRVKDYMVSEGIAPERLPTKGLNYSEPIAPNDTDANRRKNRRVDFKRLK